LFFGVGFGFSLVSFWVCLRLVSRAFICFIWSVEPFRMRLDNLFIYPLTELLEIRWTNQHCSFSLCCHIGVCVILKEVVHVNERFLPPLWNLWWVISLFSRGIFSCFTCSSFPPFFG
jgi:hypothetical protein